MEFQRDPSEDRRAEIAEEKKRLRAALIERRRGLDAEYRRTADERICSLLKAQRAYREAKLIFCYVSMDAEVDTRQLIAGALRDGKRVAAPRCGKAGGWMEAYEIRSLDDLEPGAYGILEPRTSCRRVAPEEIDLCVAPCLCVGSSGVRLGYGGGYYDRYLSRLRPGTVCAALAREKTQGPEPPAEPHDRPADILVTEKQVIFYENDK